MRPGDLATCRAHPSTFGLASVHASPLSIPLRIAEELNVSQAQVYALIRRGDLRHINVGGRGDYRIGRDDLEAYIERTYVETERWIEEHPFSDDVASHDDGGNGA